MNRILQKATAADAAGVMSLYRSVSGRPFCVWNDVYPGETEIRHDTETGNLFVYKENGCIVAALSVVPENELDGYPFWDIKGDAVKEIARVAVSPERQGNSIAYAMVTEIAARLKAEGRRAIHLSVVKGHLPALATYRKAGFFTVGEAALYGNRYFLMEKSL